MGGGGGHLNYCGIQVGPSKKISDEEEGHHILQELPVKAHQPPPPLPPHERTPSLKLPTHFDSSICKAIEISNLQLLRPVKIQKP